MAVLRFTFLRMLFEQTNTVGTEHGKCRFAALQILLRFESLIRGDHHSKPGAFRYRLRFGKFSHGSRAFFGTMCYCHVR